MHKTARRAGKPDSDGRSDEPAEILLGLDMMKALYRTVLLIRRVEERLKELLAEGLIPGFIHLSIGQEAVAAGVMSALGTEDTIASTHRAHGHAIAKGVKPERFFAELLAKEEGLCRGRGGSMHIADLSAGMMGANGIVAAGLPLMLGSALAHKVLKRPNIAVAFFGDGALGEGLVHECFNLAMLWRLPVLFVCENNGWGEFSPTSAQLTFALGDLAKVYGLPYTKVDGNDVAAVAVAARSIIAGVRRGDGPAVLECMTTRMRGHYEGDPQRYRDPAELAAAAARDPVSIAAQRLTGLGVTKATVAAIGARVARQVAEAVLRAKNGTEPSFDAAFADVYAEPIS